MLRGIRQVCSMNYALKSNILKYTIPMLCKDIMMHPSLPSFRLCGNNIHVC